MKYKYCMSHMFQAMMNYIYVWGGFAIFTTHDHLTSSALHKLPEVSKCGKMDSGQYIMISIFDTIDTSCYAVLVVCLTMIRVKCLVVIDMRRIRVTFHDQYTPFKTKPITSRGMYSSKTLSVTDLMK